LSAAATGVPVPKAAVHKDRNLMSPKNDIGAAGQVSGVAFKYDAVRNEETH
jgi:hypothetical protein